MGSLSSVIVIASRSVASSTESNRTIVAPWRPHAPFAGANVAGFARTNFCCWSRGSLTIPR
jgi:hypothetical protein